MWERRAPLGPEHVRELTKQGVKVLVQPCKRRIFIDEEYKNAGAIIKEDISDASLIIGVKKIQPENILPNKNYMFFSHVIKAQPANMSLLDTILQRNARLFDYECITKDGRDDTPRLVAFGQYAGMAGMIDGFQGLGVRLIADGNNSPFLNVPFSFMHEDLQAGTHSLTYSLTYSLTHSLTHLLTHSLTHLLTYSQGEPKECCKSNKQMQFHRAIDLCVHWSRECRQRSPTYL